MEARSREVEHLGIKVSIVEPGPYATEFGSDASLKRSPQIAAYDEARRKPLDSFDLDGIGDPAVTPEAIFRLVDADEPPLRLMLGKSVLDTTHAHYEARLATREAWAPVSQAAHGARSRQGGLDSTSPTTAVVRAVRVCIRPRSSGAPAACDPRFTRARRRGAPRSSTGERRVGGTSDACRV
jgi:hypothetical protein